MSAFLHQIFYANNKFGSSPITFDGKPSPDNIYPYPITFDGKPSQVITRTPTLSASLTPRSGVLTFLDELSKWAIIKPIYVSPITFEDKSSPVRPDGVLRRHPDTPALQSIPRTPFARTPERRRSVGVRGLSGDGLPSKDNVLFPKLIRSERNDVCKRKRR